MCFCVLSQQIAAAVNKKKTCLSLPYMGDEFLNWVYTEAEEGRWPSEIVFKALRKENVGGVDVITSRIKPGNKHIPTFCKFLQLEIIIVPLPTQSSSWPATAQGGITVGLLLEDTSWFPVSSSTTPRSTSRLTPKKCKLSGATSCTGETGPRHPCSSSPGLVMSGELTAKMETICSKR